MSVMIKIEKDCITIYDCYQYHKCEMRSILEDLRSDQPQCEVFKRTIFSLKMEWIVHKFLYCIGYKRAQTRDADLDYPCDRPEWQYICVGLLVWLFVW